MTETEEQAYEQGNRAAWRSLLQQCLQQLGYDSSDANMYRWIVEREAAIGQLRMVCAEYGDNDWTNELSLADVIEKHLYKHLS